MAETKGMDADQRSFTSKGVLIAAGILAVFIAVMVAVSASGGDDTLAATTPAPSTTPEASASAAELRPSGPATTTPATTPAATTPATTPGQGASGGTAIDAAVAASQDRSEAGTGAPAAANRPDAASAPDAESAAAPANAADYTPTQARGIVLLAAAHVEECFGRVHDYGMCTTSDALQRPPFVVVSGLPDAHEVSVAGSGENYTVTVGDSFEHLWRISKHGTHAPTRSCLQRDGIQGCTDAAW